MPAFDKRQKQFNGSISMGRFFDYCWIWCLCVVSPSIMGKTLNAMARTATNELRTLGVSVIALGMVWAGYLYVKGGQEGKQKVGEVIVGAILILGGAAIVALLRKVIGA